MASIYTSPSDDLGGIVPSATMTTPTGFYDAPMQQQTPPDLHHTPSTSGHTPQSVGQTSTTQHSNHSQQHQQTTAQPAKQNSAPQQHQTHGLTSHPQPKSVKRPRPVKSCTECRKRKLKCDRLCPCSQCQKSGRNCKYAADKDGNNSDDSDAEDGRPSKKVCGDNADFPQLTGYEMTSLPFLEHLSGRMRQLERHLIGPTPPDQDRGLNNNGPKPSDANPSTLRILAVKQGGLLLQRSRLHGPASPRVMLNLFEDAKRFLREHNKDPESSDILTSFRKMHKLLQAEYKKSLSPITVFADSMMPVKKRMQDILPKKPVCDALISSYMGTCETLFRVIHTPTFLEQYNRYWDGTLTSDYYLPQLLAVLSIASRFETKSRGLGHERVEGVHIPTACALIRAWLNTLRGKQQIELPTLQAEILLVLTKRMIKAHTRDGWTQMGYVVRLAQAMGLHRDPSEFEPAIDPFNAETRRRLWYTVADLDFFVSTDCNLPSTVREGDFTTRPPRSLDDVDLYPGMQHLPPPRPLDEPGDGHTQAYAAMSLPLRMRAGYLIHHIDQLRDFNEVLDVGTKLESHLDELNYIFPRHARPNDPSGHQHRNALYRARSVLDMALRRPLIALYRPFAMGVADCPPQIVRGYIKATIALTQMIEEIDPQMPDWRHVLDLSHITLKGDMMQAGMGICHYIRHNVNNNTSIGHALTGPLHNRNHTPESPIPNVAINGSAENMGEAMPWSTARLVRTAETCLDFLVQNIKNTDTKDIICVSVVLESVKRLHPSKEDIAHGLRVVLDRCLHAANFSLEKLAAAPPDPYQNEIPGLSRQQTYIQPQVPTPAELPSVPEEGWDFWGDGWE